jgi:hypothetical protein
MTGSVEIFGAHLVGSGPFASAEEMFRTSMAHLGNQLKRLPDGEVGERDTWIRWQNKRIGQSPQMRQQEAENIYVPFPPFEVVESVSVPDEIEFPNLGYGDAAIESYQTYKRLAADGIIPDDKRFMVGLPTPLSVATFYVAPESRNIFEQAYSRALGEEFDKMINTIPTEKLSIQWEAVSEFSLLEGLSENHIGEALLDEITSRLASLIDLVPARVEAGIHLCYGDSGHKHFCEPEDTGYLVDVANGVARKVTRPIAWIHLPVPRDRDDEAYYAPLQNLNLGDDTEVYLGLLHQTDGQSGTERRIAAASSAIKRFGIATECGLGRRDQATIPDLMDQHATFCKSE